MTLVWRVRALLAAGLGLGALVVAGYALGGAARVDAGHGLSLTLPPGAYVTHRTFTPCSDPAERFSVMGSEYVCSPLCPCIRLQIVPFGPGCAQNFQAVFVEPQFSSGAAEKIAEHPPEVFMPRIRHERSGIGHHADEPRQQANV